MARAAATEPRLCRLEHAVGRVEPCPAERCAFWEPGGAVLEGRCAFEQIDVRDNAELASWLLCLRKRLESERRSEQDEEEWRLFYRRLNEARGE